MCFLPVILFVLIYWYICSEIVWKYLSELVVDHIVVYICSHQVIFHLKGAYDFRGGIRHFGDDRNSGLAFDFL